MKDELEKALEFLPTLTQEEADLIEIVCKWPEIQKSAFVLAKKMFEEKHDAKKEKGMDGIQRRLCVEKKCII